MTLYNQYSFTGQASTYSLHHARMSALFCFSGNCYKYILMPTLAMNTASMNSNTLPVLIIGSPIFRQ